MSRVCIKVWLLLEESDRFFEIFFVDVKDKNTSTMPMDCLHIYDDFDTMIYLNN